MPEGLKTLTRHTIEEEHRYPGSTGDFSGLLNAVATAVKIIANQVNKGALLDMLGSAGIENVQGEVQKTLDVISNEVMLRRWAPKRWRTSTRSRRATGAASTCWCSIRWTARATSM